MLATVESLESSRVLNETVIKLSRKEGELKAEGRWFGQTTLLNRCRMQTFEEIPPAVQQTPSNDLDLKNRVDAFSKLGQDAEVLEEQYRVLFFRLDISGWNSAFREESCSLVTSLLDRIHGSGFYSTVMPAFQHTAFYAPTGTGCEHWDGQLGGIEGLHQYTWVNLYEAALRLTLEQLGFKAETLVRGDDWVAAIHIPRKTLANQGYPFVVQSVKTALQTACDAIEQKMKYTESFASPHLYSFGKTFILKGVWGSLLLKKGAKIHPFDNSILPTLFESIGSIYSIAHSATAALPFSLTPHLVASIINVWFCTLDKPLPQAVLLGLLYVLNVWGGHPLLSLEEMLSKGENDSLTRGASFLRWLLKEKPHHRSWILNVMNQPLRRRPSAYSFVSDIYGIPLERPARAFTRELSMLSPAFFLSLQRIPICDHY